MKTSEEQKRADVQHPAQDPLIIDLDQTLLRTDSLWELAWLSITRWKWQSFFHLWHGKAHFKHQMAQHLPLDLSFLPWNQQIIVLGEEARRQHRDVWLATGADERIAKMVADFWPFFTGYIASDGKINLTGKQKAQKLIEMFGERGFAYAGNAACDLEVWKYSAEAIVASPNLQLARQAERVCPRVTRCVSEPISHIKTACKALRVHQWSKNLLIFIPIFLAHHFSATAIASAFAAFLALNAVCSAGYLLNDLLDLASDRRHPTKRLRPLACGALSLQTGTLLAAVLLLGGGIFSALLLPAGFTGILTIYFIITMSYSLFFKRKILIDITLLSLFYTLRIIAGSVAIDVRVSQWVLIFSFFIFMMLAIVKRLVELKREKSGCIPNNTHRGYLSEDISFLKITACACMTCSILALSLYIGDSQAKIIYTKPEYLMSICPILFYWESRLLLLIERQKVDDDPVEFAIRDTTSHICLILCLIAYALAL